MPDRVTAFIDDVLAAPGELAAALAAHARAVATLPPGILARPRWRLIGMGSSRFAALDAAARLRAAGIDAVAEPASASDPSPSARDQLAVVISSSGRTPEVLAAAERHRGSSFVLALTSRPGTPLAERADAVLPLVAGRAESSGIASLSHRSTVAALALLVEARIGRAPAADPGVAIRAFADLVGRRDAWLGAAADMLDAGRSVQVLGDGARLGTVEQAALMLREAPRIPAQAFDTGEWLHVGLYTQLPGDPVLLLTGAPADEEVIATVRARGGRVVTVGARRGGADAHVPLPEAALADATVRSLVEPVVAELLAAELWRRADAVDRGEDRG